MDNRRMLGIGALASVVGSTLTPVATAIKRTVADRRPDWMRNMSKRWIRLGPGAETRLTPEGQRHHILRAQRWLRRAKVKGLTKHDCPGHIRKMIKTARNAGAV